MIVFCLVSGCVLGVFEASAEQVDLSSAVIVRAVSGEPGAKTVSLLRDEIEKRSGVRLTVTRTLPESAATSAIIVATVDNLPAGAPQPPAGFEVPEGAEGYSIWVDPASGTVKNVWCVGRDARGALFAAGRLVRVAHYEKGKVSLPADFRLATAPRYAIRGHQLGYRNTANSYDAWDIATYEQYIRDLILFGTNGIELIPSYDPELVDGPVMQRKMWDMNVDLANLIASYGLDVMFWVPALEDFAKAGEAEKALEIRKAFFESCKRIDVVLVPGGDDGENPAELLMPWLEKMAPLLFASHPHAQLWVSNQTFEHAENDYFFHYLQEKKPEWLTGVAFGPWIKMTLEELRERTPEQYLVRHYPDITHCVRCQYPMPDWDRAFAHTLGREPICPRPLDMAHIHNRYAPLTSGFVTYSDGIHDDLNKFIWSALGWDPDSDIRAVVRDYAKTFFGDDVADAAAKGLFLLEENWRGPIAKNTTIEKTLALWKDIAGKDDAQLEKNWRLQMYLFRAYYDAYVKEKDAAETAAERRAYDFLKQAKGDGLRDAVVAARQELAAAVEAKPGAELRSEIERLGRMLLDSIGFQLSVEPPYLAKNKERGAVLDWLDQPLNDRPWLEKHFTDILVARDSSVAEKLVKGVLNWENPGEGGFYDDLGNPERQPHLVKPKRWEEDPGFVESPQCEYSTFAGRMSWQDQGQTLFGTPLRMRYEGLDKAALYKIRVTYVGRFRATMRLVADGGYEVHPAMPQPSQIEPVEFDIPMEATQDGTLELEWQLIEGRGCQVGEVWLIKK